MPKQKISSRQISFIKRTIPQMPEGYYSSGPNPNLRRFVEEHATHYDPATDDYNVPPFDKPITTTKATAIYNMHTYWSKKPHDAIREYIKHYTKPGDIVLDPFCGSGGTALAALMEGRAAIAIDLSPAATFITKNYCTPVDVDELQRAFEELQAKVKPEMDWLYETRCDRCDGRATTAYTVYSYVFQCPRCLEKVALFDCPEVQSQTTAGKPKIIRICPSCQTRGHQEEIKTSGARLDPSPVLVSYFCEEGCKPRRDQRRHNDPDQKKRSYFKNYDLRKIAEIETKTIPYWYPANRMMNVPEDQERWGLLWRPYLRGVSTVADLYTKRNLWAISSLINQVNLEENPIIRDFTLFALNSIVLINSRMCDAFNTQISKGTYYTPPIFKEIRPDRSFEGKILLISEAKRDFEIKTNEICISTDSCISIKIPTNSLDYIFTDPPYSWKVQFGEANFVWESWLKFDTSWLENEIIVNDIRGKSETDWSNMLREGLLECFRVLKPGRWISLCYHDTSEGTWSLIQDIMAEIGFISEQSENTLFIDTDSKSWKQHVSEKITKRDLVINFRKPRRGELSGQIDFFGTTDAVAFRETASHILTESLTAHPGSTADRLYDELVSRMVRRGEFERHNFDELLRSVAEEVNGRWYLLETAGQLDEAESKKEVAAVRRLETFMQSFLAEHQDETGVHYSDLFEQYLPVQDKPRRLLQDWLPEFFFKTSEGTWRPPANEEERRQKADLRSSGALRRIKRFANALVDGVPPADRDKPENAVTLADWIRQCRRAGLFELGRVLYEKGGLRFEELNEEMRLLVDEDYQICVGRSEKQVTKRKAKGQQLSLMEE